MKAQFTKDKLFEIGEISQPMDFKYIGKDPKFTKQTVYRYEMHSENESYTGIFIEWPEDHTYEYHFDTIEGGSKIINKGDFYKIMSTNVHIIKDFRKRMKNPAIFIIGKNFYDNLDGSDPRENIEKFENRLKIYYRYIQKNSEGETIKKVQNEDGSIKAIVISNWKY